MTEKTHITYITGTRDTELQMLLMLPDSDLASLCTINSTLRSLCNSEYLWQRKLSQRFSKKEILYFTPLRNTKKEVYQLLHGLQKLLVFFHKNGYRYENIHTIEKLWNLPMLDLSDNNLSSLPPEIGNLTNLTILYLYSNNLFSLPVEIGNLRNLRELYLSNNNLSSLPASIGNLTNLQFLYLANNNLSSLPSEMGNLINLRRLNLYRNKFSSTPPEVRYLFDLGNLQVV